jgi:hypothetical protein
VQGRKVGIASGKGMGGFLLVAGDILRPRSLGEVAKKDCFCRCLPQRRGCKTCGTVMRVRSMNLSRDILQCSNIPARLHCTHAGPLAQQVARTSKLWKSDSITRGSIQCATHLYWQVISAATS